MKENTILLVEDNPDDIELVMHEFNKLEKVSHVEVVNSGEAALDYVLIDSSDRDSESRNKPDLIVLDLGLPGMNGLELLKRIKANQETKRIPVVVLTVSDDQDDIVKSYNYGVNSFLSKPLDFARFAFTMEQLGIYWLNVNEPSPH